MQSFLIIIFSIILSIFVFITDAIPSPVLGRSSRKVGDIDVLLAERALQDAERNHRNLIDEGHEHIQTLADLRVETIRHAKNLASAGFPVIPSLRVTRPMDTTIFADAVSSFDSRYADVLAYKASVEAHQRVLQQANKGIKAQEAQELLDHLEVAAHWAAEVPKDEDGDALLHELQVFRVTKSDERRLADVMRYERMTTSIVYGLRRLKLEW